MAIRIILFMCMLHLICIACQPVETEKESFVNVNYNITHLKTGDALPTRNAKLRLFGMRFCPYTEKVVFTLNAKNLEYDFVLINLSKKPDWFHNFNVKETVPVLQIENNAIFDSSIISTYLDEQYPQIPLQANDPLSRAEDKMIVEIFSSAQSAFSTAAYHPDKITSSTHEDFDKGLQYLESVLESHNTKFLFGDEPGLVDYTILPFLERFGALPLLGRDDFGFDKTKYRLLGTYMEDMKALPAVKGFYLSPEIQTKFIESKIKGEPNYDLLVTKQ